MAARRCGRKLPLAAAPVLKDKTRFRLIGKPLPRLDRPSATAAHGLRHRRRGARHAQRRRQDGALVHRAGHGDPQQADILKMPGVHAVVKIAALAIANEDPGSQHPRVPHLPRPQRGLRGRRPVLAGAARARRARGGVRRRRLGRSLQRQDRRHAQRRARCRARRHRAGQGRPRGSCRSAPPR